MERRNYLLGETFDATMADLEALLLRGLGTDCLTPSDSVRGTYRRGRS